MSAGGFQSKAECKVTDFEFSCAKLKYYDSRSSTETRVTYQSTFCGVVNRIRSNDRQSAFTPNWLNLHFLPSTGIDLFIFFLLFDVYNFVQKEFVLKLCASCCETFHASVKNSTLIWKASGKETYRFNTNLCRWRSKSQPCNILKTTLIVSIPGCTARVNLIGFSSIGDLFVFVLYGTFTLLLVIVFVGFEITYAIILSEY